MANEDVMANNDGSASNEKGSIDLYFSPTANEAYPHASPLGTVGTPYACDKDGNTIPYSTWAPHGTKLDQAASVRSGVPSTLPDLKLLGTVPVVGDTFVFGGSNDGVKLTPGMQGKHCHPKGLVP